MGKIWTAAALALLASPVLAHDFWIQPSRFLLDEPGTVPLTMFVGHGQARDRWGVGADYVTMFKTLGPEGMVDRREELQLGANAFDARVPLARNGAYLFGLQSDRSESRLPALRFNDYVKEEGLSSIAAYRKRNDQEQAEGREVYSRRAKAIVQVGPVDAASVERVTRPVGLRLEIVPERHPQSLAAGSKLPVKVLYRGRPLSGALVKLNDLSADDKPVAMRRTDENGRAVFSVPQAGKWQMNVVWGVPLANRAKADFDTTFSSLTFATD